MVTIELVCWPCLICAISATAPNIMFIMADDLGWSDVSWHDANMDTPNLYHLAHTNAVKLEAYYVNMLCSPFVQYVNSTAKSVIAKRRFS